MSRDASRFSVKTDAFDGPLDLLLHLIEKHEVDIFDIPIALITEQYLWYMKSGPMKGLEMGALSEFLLMAATLLHIKSRMLLPDERTSTPDQEEDPREELVERLLAYKRFKDLADGLTERGNKGARALYRDRDASITWEEPTPSGPISGMVPIEKLRDIFADLLLRIEKKADRLHGGFKSISWERFTVPDKVRYIVGLLKKAGSVRFKDLFREDATKDEAITTFLALLELIRQNRVLAVQDAPFDDIMCKLKDNRDE